MSGVASVGVQVGVELTPGALAGQRLQRAAHAVAAEEQPAATGELPGLHDRPVGERDPRPTGDVAAGLDDAAVAEGDADAGVGTQQASAADGDHLRTTAGE